MKKANRGGGRGQKRRGARRRKKQSSGINEDENWDEIGKREDESERVAVVEHRDGTDQAAAREM